MEIKLQINKCSECKHSDHTGAFTKGGAKPCCGHPITVKEKGYSCFDRIIPYRTEPSKLFPNSRCFKNDRIPNRIPSWCPLKRGSKY